MVTPGDLPAYRIGGCLAIVLAMSLPPPCTPTHLSLTPSLSLSFITGCDPVPSCLLQRDCNVKILVNYSDLRAVMLAMMSCRVYTLRCERAYDTPFIFLVFIDSRFLFFFTSNDIETM